MEYYFSLTTNQLQSAYQPQKPSVEQLHRAETVHAEENLLPLLQLHAVEREGAAGACETEAAGCAGGCLGARAGTLEEVRGGKKFGRNSPH